MSRSSYGVTSRVRPTSSDYPIGRPLTILSGAALTQLARCYDAPFDPARTVGDVQPYRQRRYANIGQAWREPTVSGGKHHRCPRATDRWVTLDGGGGR